MCLLSILQLENMVSAELSSFSCVSKADVRNTIDIIEGREYHTAWLAMHVGEKWTYCRRKWEVQRKGRRPHAAEVGQKSEGKQPELVLVFTEKPPCSLHTKCCTFTSSKPSCLLHKQNCKEKFQYRTVKTIFKLESHPSCHITTGICNIMQTRKVNHSIRWFSLSRE